MLLEWLGLGAARNLLPAEKLVPCAWIRPTLRPEQGRTDVDCDRPVIDWTPIGEDGWIDSRLFEDFAGFVELRGEQDIPQAYSFVSLAPGVTFTHPPGARSTPPLVADAD